PLLHAAAAFVHIAETDRLRRARLLASGLNRSIHDRGPAHFRGNLRAANSLHAIGALLHHAAAADRDIRIAQRLERLRREIREGEEIEATNLVRAVVRAVTRADAAVVCHVVEAVVAVHRRPDRADVFARGVLA